MNRFTMNRLKRNLVNLPAKKIQDKVVVFESDDWGSIRMPSVKIYQRLLSEGLVLASDPFSRLDSLEKTEDLEMLFDVLSSVKDSLGKPAILTANTIMANPDFEAIKSTGYQKYFFESTETTIDRYTGSDRVLNLWKEGADNAIYIPQLHGREHVNVVRWLQNLQEDTNGFRMSFEMNTFALNGRIAAAFNAANHKEALMHEKIIADAQNLFKDVFGKKSETFIAPNYTWPKSLESILKKNGIKMLQGSRVQNRPNLNGGLSTQYHFSGQRNAIGQFYLVRNCLFEPSLSPDTDYVSACLRNISNAFYWKVPAIVGTHRINFVSRNNIKNRDKNLIAFKKLLFEIVKRWPDVIFLSSDTFCNRYLSS